MTARPPEMSYVAPVENEHSSLASQQTNAATSSARPILPIGIRSTMYSTCACETPSRMGVSITAGATQLTTTPVRARSLPIALVSAMTAALEAE